MKRLAIIPTVFAFVVMVAACTDTTAPDFTPQFDRASQPNCVEVLASSFARDANPGLRTELQDTMDIAAFFNIPVGTVIERLTGRTGSLGQCFGFLVGGG